MGKNKVTLIASIAVVVVGLVGYVIGQANTPTDANAHLNANSTHSTSIHESNSATDSNEYFSNQGPIDVEVQLGSDKISVKDGIVYMLITLKGDKIEITKDQQERLPLNLSIVLDRSGSMGGDKIENVKEALHEITSLLSHNDRISLVTYDDYVETVYSSNHFDKHKFLNVVDEVYSRGSTNLEGGLRKGLKNVKMHDSSDYINRVILLSDGLANVGVSDAGQLANIVEELAGGNITVSTIGVGSDYDEHLMTSVARAGNGNYYFMEDSRDAERIFTEEFESVLNTVARDITIEFNIDNDFEVVRGIGYELEDSSYYKPYDIYSEREVSYLFEIKAKDLDDLTLSDLDLADLKIRFNNVDNGNEETINVPIKVSIVDADVNALSDDDVYYDYMQSYKAEILWDVYEDLDKLDNEKARTRSDELIEELKKANERLEGEFDDDLANLKEKREYLEDLESEDVNESASGRIFQKSNQYDSYQKMYNK